MAFSYPYPRPAVTCDTVVFTMRADDLAVLLIRRKDEPFKGAWALPGGFVDENESLDRAAARELYEETGLSGLRLEQIGAFGDPGRDPRGHTVTVAYVAFQVAEATITAGDDATLAEFVPMRQLALESPSDARGAKRKKTTATVRAAAAHEALRARRAPAPRGRRGGRKSSAPEPYALAFDHARIVAKAYARLCRHLDNPVRDPAFDLVPPRFTLAELQRIYEVVLGRALDPRAFKKNLLRGGLAVPASSKPTPKASTQLYRWNRR